MIISGGKVLGIDHVEVDNVTITGDGVFPSKVGGKPLGIGPGVISTISAATYSAVSGQVSKLVDEKVKTVSSNLDNKIKSLSSEFKSFEKNTEETFDDFVDWSKNIEQRVSDLEERPIGGSAVLTKDLFVTNSLGSIKQFSTIPSGTPLENIWTSALKTEYKPEAGSITTNLSSLIEYPTTANLDKISFKATAGNYPITAFAFKVGNNQATSATTAISAVDESGVHTGTMTSAVSYAVSSPISVFASAFDGVNNPVTSTANISFAWPYFYGQDVNSAIDIASLKKITPLTKQGNKTVKYDAFGQYLIFAFDSSYPDLKEIKDTNGFITTSGFIKTTATYQGHTYKVYVSNEVKTYNENYTFNHG